MTHELQFDAVSERLPGHKWLERWMRSWPAYRSWFLTKGGHKGPSRIDCENALRQYMPELIPTWKRLSLLTGDDDLSARFLSTWCPPAYLGGCSLAALSRNGTTRLVRNYDLSPDLNEGLLLHTAWTGTPVMGMVEFLWGLSDGINQKGLAVALAFGGSRAVDKGFGITTILRYVLETCGTVEEALAALRRVPSHMAYNVTLADSTGMTLSVEMQPGGGLQVMSDSIATNHQHGSWLPEKPLFTQTFERFDHLYNLLASDVDPASLVTEFMTSPLYQDKYSDSLGTLFTADYNPVERSMTLHWKDGKWSQSLDDFQEGCRRVVYGASISEYPQESEYPHETVSSSLTEIHQHVIASSSSEWVQHLAILAPYIVDQAQFAHWLDDARLGEPDWAAFGRVFTGTHAAVRSSAGTSTMQ